MNSTLVHDPASVVYEPVPGVFAGVKPACPRCPWRGQPLAAGTRGWRTRLAHDLAGHQCTAPPDLEEPS